MITDNIYFTQKTYPIIQQIENEIDDAIVAEKFLYKRRNL